MIANLADSEDYLLNSCQDFSATYMAVSMLEYDIGKDASLASLKTIEALGHVITKRVHSAQRQSYFLYRKAAKTLLFLSSVGEDQRLASASLERLKNIVAETSGPSHRAAAEALGALPLKIQGPCLNKKSIKKVSTIRWNALCRETGLDEHCEMRHIGRSLVLNLAKDSILVIKCSRSESENSSLNREASWMAYLQEIKNEFPTKFHIPVPIKFQGSYLFRLINIPEALKKKINISMYAAIGFTVHPDYFIYPNPLPDEKSVDWEDFTEVMGRNAWLLGKLSSKGIVHTAPIPLFHNRIQRHRRNDDGFYEWPRGGRLDRWLTSCRYPNLGKSGIRDFEHFEAVSGFSRRYYQLIGNHFISIVLICASYFRNHCPELVGLDENGSPVDTRKLFQPELMCELLETSFNAYYEGFTGRETDGALPVDFDLFVSRAIDEFGVDQYMEEVLRVADQREMSDDEFIAFLSKNGISGSDKDEPPIKGLADIPITTGPHLGDFNRTISLPELIHMTGTVASYCISDRYIIDLQCGNIRRRYG